MHFFFTSSGHFHLIIGKKAGSFLHSFFHIVQVRAKRVSLHHTTNQKLLSRCKIHFRLVLGLKCYINQTMKNMSRTICKNLWYMNRIKTRKFDVCACHWSGDYRLRVEGKTHFEKMAWKYMYCEILYIVRCKMVKKKGHNILLVDISMTLPR